MSKIVPLCAGSIVMDGMQYACWLPAEHSGPHWRAQSHGFNLPIAWIDDELVTIYHAPKPGPMYWDWRCLVCGEPCARHAGLIARLIYRLRAFTTT